MAVAGGGTAAIWRSRSRISSKWRESRCWSAVPSFGFGVSFWRFAPTRSSTLLRLRSRKSCRAAAAASLGGVKLLNRASNAIFGLTTGWIASGLPPDGFALYEIDVAPVRRRDGQVPVHLHPVDQRLERRVAGDRGGDDLIGGRPGRRGVRRRADARQQRAQRRDVEVVAPAARRDRAAVRGRDGDARDHADVGLHRRQRRQRRLEVVVGADGVGDVVVVQRIVVAAQRLAAEADDVALRDRHRLRVRLAVAVEHDLERRQRDRGAARAPQHRSSRESLRHRVSYGSSWRWMNAGSATTSTSSLSNARPPCLKPSVSFDSVDMSPAVSRRPSAMR